jgi:hypothetical protein
MALASVGLLNYPAATRFLAGTGVSNNTSYQINGTGQRLAWILAIPRTGTITRVGWRVHTCATAQLSRLGLYTVTSGIFPTTTGYGGSVYGTYTPAATTYFEVTLGTSATATLGDVAAIVTEFDSTAGDMYGSSASGGGEAPSGAGWAKYNGTTWSRTVGGGFAFAHLYYSDGVVVDAETCPFTGTQTEDSGFNLNSTPDEYAIKLTMPFACRIVGIWSNYRTPNAAADYEIRIYSGTTALTTTAIDAEYAGGTTGVRRLLFASPVTVAAGATIRAAIRPTTSTTAIFRYHTLSAAGYGTGVGLQSGDCLSTRTDLGSWSDTTTQIPHMGVVIDQLDDGVGGGGLLYSPVGGGFLL